MRGIENIIADNKAAERRYQEELAKKADNKPYDQNLINLLAEQRLDRLAGRAGESYDQNLINLLAEQASVGVKTAA